MRIGIMLRAYDRPGGIGIYSRNIVEHLLRLDSRNEYVLFHSNPAHLGMYAGKANVQDVHIPPGNPVAWDQWKIPRAIRTGGVDLVFNTKFSVPLFTRARRVMVLHGASWFVHPELYTPLDIFYVRRSMPVYCRAADFMISNSELTTRDFIRILKVPADKIETVLLAAGEAFRPVMDAARLQDVRRRYSLPERFVLTVTSFDPRKNFQTLVRAFEAARKQTDVDLVVVGKNCQRYGESIALPRGGDGPAVHFPGWVDQKDLPAIYSLARAFVFPSVYEEFGIPVVEAMSCGCPIAASRTGAIPELTAGAALLCDPFDADALAGNLVRILTSEAESARCRAAGLARAEDFSWERNARRTLEIFDRVGGT